ncbi:phosphoribosylanthranilate isomerase [Aestuariibaculum sp. YM273]|uniref:phosphoribosylanthranilate isomerase n=1 Tax=Aestuariibaculum sp. YM273 TaxID=3070659 RepID=UPI0027DC195B|nr:phosphoribosylanthranilate isomerase [Aestuariibaculum sp. YM273]WMI65977.1 phosphoribosylanthranilate isomerase [Aestuariibaculum sp. YM273]
MKLKVCGMKYKDNIQAVADLQPDYLGFIFYEKSARCFNTSIPDISKSIKKTGVFVNETLDFVIEQIQKHDLQAVQLHGEESPEYCKQLKNCNAELVSASLDKDLKHLQVDKSLEIIKVFSIKDKFNFEVLTPYEQVCDYFLFDTKGKLPGGNGYTFDWNVLNDYPSTKPFFLSGGIGLDEAEKLNAFKQSPASTYCYAIDVNSKFEIEPGLKHIEQLKQFKEALSFIEH